MHHIVEKPKYLEGRFVSGCTYLNPNVCLFDYKIASDRGWPVSTDDWKTYNFWLSLQNVKTNVQTINDRDNETYDSPDEEEAAIQDAQVQEAQTGKETFCRQSGNKE